MNLDESIPDERTERERQRRFAELDASEGPGWTEQYKAGSFGCHELLDRTAGLADQIEDRLLSHPSCVMDPEWYAAAERATEALRDLYQRIGAEHG